MFILLDNNNLVVDVCVNTFNVVDQLTWLEVPDDTAITVGCKYEVNLIPEMKYNHLMATKSNQIKKISDLCQKQITGGFDSIGPTGSNYYSSSFIDQQNIVQAAQSENGGLLSCSSNGSWTKLQHSPIEAKKILNDFISFKDNLRIILSTKIQEINACTDEKSVTSINW